MRINVRAHCDKLFEKVISATIVTTQRQKLPLNDYQAIMKCFQKELFQNIKKLNFWYNRCDANIILCFQNARQVYICADFLRILQEIFWKNDIQKEILKNINMWRAA